MDREDGDTLVKAHAAMGGGEWAQATPLLEELRQRHPSDAGLLSDLGWCRFVQAPRDPRAIDKALEWADLGLAFDPEYADAIEVRARILAVTDRREIAMAAVRRLLKVRSDSEWGRAELGRLSEVTDEEPKGRSGLGRFLSRRR